MLDRNCLKKRNKQDIPNLGDEHLFSNMYVCMYIYIYITHIYILYTYIHNLALNNVIYLIPGGSSK